MAVVSDSGTDPENSNYYVVSSVGEALNNQGDTGKMLECVNTNSGETVKVVTEKGYFPEYSTNDKTITGNQLDVGIGDIVRFGYNSFGDVSGIIMDYDCSTGTVIEKNPGSWYVSPRLVRAAVYSVSQGFFTYVNADSISDASSVINQLQIGSASNVITVDLTAREENVVKTEAATSLIGYIEDEINYSKLIYISSYGETRAVINYK